MYTIYTQNLCGYCTLAKKLLDSKNLEYKEINISENESAKRFLAFFFYLNDTDDESGCTEFPHFNLKVVPKTNRMLVFPPMWTYLHAGRKVTGKTPKYTMGSYLHYV